MVNNKATYILAFAVSILLHMSVFEGWKAFSIFKPPEPRQLPAIHPELKMRFVDSYKDEPQEPDVPTRNISDASNKAAQPEPPPEPAERTDAPYLPEQGETPLTRTRTAPGQPIPMPPGQSVAQQKQSPKLAEPTQTSSDDMPDEKPVEQKKVESVKIPPPPEPEQPVEKVVEIAKPQEEDESAQPDTLAMKPMPDVPQIPSGGVSTPTPADPIKGKIDELLHQEEVDLEAVAELIKELQFNISKNRLGTYYAELKRKVARNWRTRMLAYGSEMFASRAVVVFKISESGDIEALECVYDDGNPFFRDDCIAAIRESAQFEPLPAEYIQNTGKKELWIYATFGYNR